MSTDISFLIEKQFPGIYREEGQELIEFVKEYYKFLETNSGQSVYNIRRMSEYRDIDTTLDRMLVFFKNKFLNGIFIDKDERFIVKNILDLYRRKGSNEGIQLFFKLFFNEEASIYYPSFDIFKPSSSIWKVDRYIQLYNILRNEKSIFNDILTKKIYGSISKAEAFVDNIYFISIDNSYIPIIVLDVLKGSFDSFDNVYSVDSNSDVKTYGTVYGSLREVRLNSDINVPGFSNNNRIGEIVNINSPDGFGGKGRVAEISESVSTEIAFSVIDGGFGYIDPTSNSAFIGTNEVLIGDQSIFVNGNVDNFFTAEKVTQLKTGNTAVFGTIVGKGENKIVVNLDDANSEFEAAFSIETVDREVNISSPISFVTPSNTSASFDIGTITILDEIKIIPDVIGNFLDVSIDANNYSDLSVADAEMSGTIVNGTIPSLSTPLSEAFIVQDIEIGSVSSITNINRGTGYTDDVFTLIRQPFIYENYGSQITGQIIVLSESNPVTIIIGDILEQEQTLSDWNNVSYTKTIRGEVIDISNNLITLKQLTLEQFDPNLDIFIQDIATPIEFDTITSDGNNIAENIIGTNANIKGALELNSGKILAVDVFDSGFGYINEGSVILYNQDKLLRLQNTLEQQIADGDTAGAEQTQIAIDQSIQFGDALGNSLVFGQGFSEGKFISFDSQISDIKVIQDSFFYQDFSYEISTSLSDAEFKETYFDIMHPAGTKLFTKFVSKNQINTDTSIEVSIDSGYYEDGEWFLEEDEINLLGVWDDEQDW